MLYCLGILKKLRIFDDGQLDVSQVGDALPTGDEEGEEEEEGEGDRDAQMDDVNPVKRIWLWLKSAYWSFFQDSTSIERPWPWWCTILAWTMVWLIVIAASFFIILYR